MNQDTQVTIVDALRAGTVPSEGLEHLAVGVEAQAAALREQRELAGRGRSVLKLVRGGYGSGKTFLTSLAAAQALQEGFVVSRVVVSARETPLHKLESVYRRLCLGLSLPSRPRGGALQALVDRWLYGLEETVLEVQGLSEDSPEFAAAVRAMMEQRLLGIGEQAGRMAACLAGYHSAQMAQDFAAARDLIDWLAGEAKVAGGSKRLAGLTGQLTAADTLAFLKGLLVVLSQAGYKGLVLVLDEVETIVRLNRPERLKALEVLRQLVDAVMAQEFPGLVLLVTGTPDLFESAQGVPSLQPLYERVRVEFREGEPDNLRQPQIRLRSFDRSRLLEVARRVRSLYPAQHPERVARATDAVLEDLADRVTRGFGGRLEVTPRLFLRELVNMLDLFDQHAEYSPGPLRVEARELEPTEAAAWVEI